MSAVTVKKPVGDKWLWGHKPCEPLSAAAQRDEPLTAAASLSCQDAVERMFYCSPKQNIISSSSVHIMSLQILKDLSRLRKKRRLWPLLYTASLLADHSSLLSSTTPRYLQV